MNPVLFARLFDAIEKFIAQNCESEEWEIANFFAHENLALHMAQAAGSVFTATVESSVYTKDGSR